MTKIWGKTRYWTPQIAIHYFIANSFYLFSLKFLFIRQWFSENLKRQRALDFISNKNKFTGKIKHQKLRFLTNYFFWFLTFFDFGEKMRFSIKDFFSWWKTPFFFLFLFYFKSNFAVFKPSYPGIIKNTVNEVWSG